MGSKVYFPNIFWLREVQGRSNWQVTRFLHHNEKNFQCTGIWKRDRFLNTSSGYWVSCFFCTLEGSMYAYQRMFMMLRKRSRSLHWGQKLISPDAQVRVRSGWGWREWLYVCTPSSTPKANFESIYVRQEHPRPKAQGLRGFRKEWHIGQEHPRPVFCTPTSYPEERRSA